MRRATIKDVAEKAKVSLKTVSRVINNEPSVMQATRARVLRAIAELDYEPDPSARNLRSGTTFVIGLVYDNPNPYHIIGVQNGVLAPAARPVSVCRSTLRFQFAAAGRRAGRLGAAFAPGRAGADRTDVRAPRPDPGADRARHQAGAHHRRHRRPGRWRLCVRGRPRGAYEITEHLIQLGHQRIGFLWGGSSHRSSGELRRLRTALKDYGMTVDKHLVVQGDYTFDDGFRGARLLRCASHLPPSSVPTMKSLPVYWQPQSRPA